MNIRNQKSAEKLEVPMTPMIDIVFQLLVFFVMTFKIVAPEGDFNVKMPATGQPETPEPLVTQTIKIRIQANPAGDVSSIQMGGIVVDSLESLRAEVLRTVQVSNSEEQQAEWEVELDCDHHLHYAHVITAIDAVTGQVKSDGRVERIVEKFKFAQPRTTS